MSKSRITKIDNQSALVTDTAVEDFYFRDWLYLGDHNLANITDHEGAYIVLDEDVRATVGGGTTNISSSTTSLGPTATTIITRSSSNQGSTIN